MSPFSRTLIALIVALGAGRAAWAQQPVCKPFEVFPGVALPAPAPQTAWPAPSGWEQDLVSRISREGPDHGFAKIYAEFSGLQTIASEPEERFRLLSCLLHYVRQDFDHDGISDWSAVVDNRPSTMLVPFDDDMDGDGVENVLDPNPLTANDSDAPGAGVPRHLVLSQEGGPEAGRLNALQETLWRRHGLLAVNHSGGHSTGVLETVTELLDSALPPGILRRMGNARYLYAFRSHDQREDIAAYHRAVKSLSIGGVATWSDAPSATQRAEIATSIAHEIGHAFVFARLSPAQLADAGARLGGWPDVPGADVNDGFYSEAFLRSHPMARRGRDGRSAPLSEVARVVGVDSSYALVNLHEWFAEGFAAVVTQKAADRGDDGLHAGPELIGWLQSRLGEGS